MSGYVGDLSPHQEIVLQQFKEAVADIPNKPDNTDHFYLRWLRARKFNLQKAEAIFRNHIEYRQKYGADTILHDYTPPELFTECLAGGFFGEDLEGHPVWYENLGNADIRGMYNSLADIDEILKFKCLLYEQMDLLCKKQSEKKGRHIETVTAVVDLKNFSFQKTYFLPAVEMLLKIMTVQEANNPERTKTVLLINTPKMFPFCYNIVKPIFDSKTTDKIITIGNNSNLKEELQKYISLDELPAMYGGNRYAPDAECSDFIKPGQDVPPKYYLTNQMTASRDSMTRVVVGRGLVHEVCCEVAEVGSTLRWEFFSTDYDISFGVHMKKKLVKKTEKQTILALSRTRSHLYPHTGHHHCLTSGEYVLEFNNIHSWVRSKEVFYSFKILPPNVQPPPDIVQPPDIGGPSTFPIDEFATTDVNVPPQLHTQYITMNPIDPVANTSASFSHTATCPPSPDNSGKRSKSSS